MLWFIGAIVGACAMALVLQAIYVVMSVVLNILAFGVAVPIMFLSSWSARRKWNRYVKSSHYSASEKARMKW